MNRGIYELYHHGIKKQKWGVRNGPPYPLDYEDHSAAEKKQMTKGSSKFENTTERVKNRLNEGLVKIGLKKANELVDKTQGTALLDFIDSQRTQYDISQGKKFFDGMVDQQVGWIDDQGKANYTDYDSDSIVRIKRVKEGNDHYDYVGQRDIDRINPDFHDSSKRIGSTNNCVSCTLTTELYRQGYAGVMAGKSMFGHRDSDVEKYFPGAKVEGISNIGSDIDSWVKNKYGAGSSGYFAGSRTVTDETNGSKTRVGGHAMHWAMDNNGVMRVTDAQNGKTYNSLWDACQAEGFDINYRSSISRLDNVRPDIDRLNHDGIIRPSWSSIDGHQTETTYRAKNSTDVTPYDSYNYKTARDEAKANAYKAYKEYKKQFY